MTRAVFSMRTGHIARAMAQVQAKKPERGEATGAMVCPKCGSILRFNILATGFSRGWCIASGCIRWAQ